MRQLCDWAMFVDKRMTEELWLNIKLHLEEYGLLYLTGIITRACVDYLGFSKEKAEWALDYDKELASKIMERIMESGNFGRKEEAYGQRYFTDVKSTNRITSFIHVLISACKYHWPICEKCLILMPIAPFVIYGKYLKMYKAGERPKIEVVSL